MKKIQFKGGSLSETCLIIDGEKEFVRKTVSLTENREYGFNRWYTQLKRLQRYSILFPGLFPTLLSYGKDGDFAYFDIEYYADAVNAHTYVNECRDAGRIHTFFDSLKEAMNRMHSVVSGSCHENIDLYIYQEVELKLNDCFGNKVFKDFLNYDEIVFNGTTVRSLYSQLDEYKSLCRKFHTFTDECFTHGNITLENLLYIPASNRVIFIDPYDENVIDSKLAEYSQLYQSCSGNYEVYNSMPADVQGNSISLKAEKTEGMKCFDSCFTEYLHNTLDISQYYMVRLFEISQFIRMLPFKMVVDESKMIFFYGLASYLYDRLKNEIKENGDI